MAELSPIALKPGEQSVPGMHGVQAISPNPTGYSSAGGHGFVLPSADGETGSSPSFNPHVPGELRVIENPSLDPAEEKVVLVKPDSGAKKPIRGLSVTEAFQKLAAEAPQTQTQKALTLPTPAAPIVAAVQEPQTIASPTPLQAVPVSASLSQPQIDFVELLGRLLAEKYLAETAVAQPVKSAPAPVAPAVPIESLQLPYNASDHQLFPTEELLIGSSMLGFFDARFHAVIPTPSLLTLVFDTRCKGYHMWLPPFTIDKEAAMELKWGDKTYRVMNVPGCSFQLGTLLFCILFTVVGDDGHGKEGDY